MTLLKFMTMMIKKKTIKQVKSFSAQKHHSPSKINIRKMIKSSMCPSTDASLYLDPPSPPYRGFEEISCPSAYKHLSSSQHSSRTIDKSFSPKNRQVNKKTNVSNTLVIAKTNNLSSTKLSCPPNDEIFSQQKMQT